MKQSLEDFVKNGSPPEWHEYAEELMESAKVLYDSSRDSIVISHDNSDNQLKNKPALSRTIILLAGLAIENSIKGYLISKKPSYINSGTISQIKTHAIVELIQKIDDIDFSKKEMDICVILQNAIPYWSRYPIPKRFEMIQKEHIINNDFFDVIKALFNKLQKNLYWSYRDGWDPRVGEPLIKSRNPMYESDE